MDILLVKLIIAHLIGDFFLQPDAWVKEKEEKKLRSSKLYLHILLHGALTFLLLWNVRFLPEIAFLMLTHGAIDALKLFAQKEHTRRWWFFVDQLLHLLIILIIWHFASATTWDFTFLSDTKNWTIIGAVLLLSQPASIIIKVLIAKWTPSALPNQLPETSLQSAGKYIGILERLLIFLFILTNHFEAVGFLLAAKSIFRFGDLKEAKDLKMTEYVLIGTLLSFGLAIAISLIVKEITS